MQEQNEQVKKLASQKATILSENKLSELKITVDKLEMEYMKTINKSEKFDYLISKSNYCVRKKDFTSPVRYIIGNICYFDYGQAYDKEIGYLHFGIILSKSKSKVFVVPFISEKDTKYYNKTHTMKIPKIQGLYARGVLYLDDAKWINSSRIIDVKSYINPKSLLFQNIKKAVISQIVDGSK